MNFKIQESLFQNISTNPDVDFSKALNSINSMYDDLFKTTTV